VPDSDFGDTQITDWAIGKLGQKKIYTGWSNLAAVKKHDKIKRSLIETLDRRLAQLSK
jgi:hypothetical protein